MPCATRDFSVTPRQSSALRCHRGFRRMPAWTTSWPSCWATSDGGLWLAELLAEDPGWREFMEILSEDAANRADWGIVSDPVGRLKENEWPTSPRKRRDIDGKDRHAYQVARANFRVPCMHAMELWQMDIVGGFPLADGTSAKALTGIDDHSRMCVCARLMARERTRTVCDGLRAALAIYGVTAADPDRQRQSVHRPVQPSPVSSSTPSAANTASNICRPPRAVRRQPAKSNGFTVGCALNSSATAGLSPTSPWLSTLSMRGPPTATPPAPITAHGHTQPTMHRRGAHWTFAHHRELKNAAQHRLGLTRRAPCALSGAPRRSGMATLRLPAGTEIGSLMVIETVSSISRRLQRCSISQMRGSIVRPNTRQCRRGRSATEFRARHRRLPAGRW